MRSVAGLLALALTLPVASAHAAPFVVTSTADPGDGVCDTTECTLREAIDAANVDTTADTITFSVAGPIVPASALPAVSNPITIDGGSGRTEIRGPGAGSAVAGLQINVPAGPATVVRNLVLDGFQLGIDVESASATTIQSNFIGTTTAGTAAQPNSTGVYVGGSGSALIGGTAVGAGNLISGNTEGVWLQNGVSHVVQGNLIGTDVNATGAIPNGSGVRVSGGFNAVIGGTAAGAANVISGNTRGIAADGGSGLSIVGNVIGLDGSGTAPLGNATAGIELGGAGQHVGGTVAGAGNVVAANGYGIQIDPSATGVVIEGNHIGTRADGGGGLALGNHNAGVSLQDASGATIGGAAPGAGNVIANNAIALASAGVQLLGGLGNRVLGNSIFANNGLAIELGEDGVTLNDPGDLDTNASAPFAANDLQNFPDLTNAVGSASSTTISGTLNSQPNTTYRIEAFLADPCDPTLYGEGNTYLGSFDVATDSSGNAAFTQTLPAGGSAPAVTATATDPAGNTSELSKCVARIDAAPPTSGGPAGGSDPVAVTRDPAPAGGPADVGVAGPPPPVVGRAVDVAVEGGTVLVKLPGSARFKQLGGVDQIPVGSTVDVTKGQVALTSAADGAGHVQTASFSAGSFVVTQPRSARPITELRLAGPSCTPATGALASAKKKRRVRRLWGDGHGRFRTRGNYGTATVQGTRWLTEDRCDGTLVRVARGVVAVRDLVRRRTIVVRAGHSYLARARR
jgi:CSLREA domain-containing protein